MYVSYCTYWDLEITSIIMVNRTDRSQVRSRPLQRVGQSVRITFKLVSKVLNPVLSPVLRPPRVTQLVDIIMVENEVLVMNEEWEKTCFYILDEPMV